MVQEVRKIVLSKGELAMALCAYRKVDPAYLPSGKILRCDVNESSLVDVEIESEELSDLPITEINRVTLGAKHLTEAMINFCIEHRIMLPRNGRKSAMLVGNSPALFVEMETHAVIDFES